MTTAPALQQLVLKVHSRCDLACDHCYVYEHADQSWSRRPKIISQETVQQVAHRLATYAKERELPTVSVILHGGEPLLAGPVRLRRICEALTAALTPVTSLDLRIHTNGVQLGPRHLEVFREFDVKVGISLDGDRAANDRHRLDRRGRSSYDRVLRAVELLRAPHNRHLFAGLLCTVDIENDPVAVHDALAALDPPRIDYLLPHSTWDSPPPPGPSGPDGSPTPYADWLLAVYDRWEQRGRSVPVRIFESVLSTLGGGPSLTEALGLAPSDLAVVETDGTFEQVDSLKTAYEGAAETGYDVLRHSFAELAEHPGVRARQLGIDGVSETCRACPVVESCGGGLYAHRYSAARGFDNPSVFCEDLRAFIEGVAERAEERAPAARQGDDPHFAHVEYSRRLFDGQLGLLATRPDCEEAWRLLSLLDADERTRPHVDAVLGHPYLLPVLSSLSLLPGGSALFMAIVVAAAVRAGRPTTLSWDQPGRELHLPTLGTVTLPEPGRVEVTVTADGFQVRSGPDTEPGAWRPLETVELADGTSVLVDDADPLRRDSYPVPVAPPLAPADLDAFRERLRAAFGLLDALRSGRPGILDVTTVTPLPPGAGPRLGTHGYGALGLAVDFDPEQFVRELPRIGRPAGEADTHG
ncbi:FxsB family cyclophane-forming radical SAM/SPASM peptide maturase [Streptomyces sp. CGMCC 4.7035]|nr:FxsB family cyclophane-forming radical SAM/SPASM peptide maturase [Streptomyces sp. CGMCC 4.7035]WNC01681.1 FxsB family cyclophane-forming radical SAM/SPASM peptide maturase [Streptomyces sp. CGMCC 4.7035]